MDIPHLAMSRILVLVLALIALRALRPLIALVMGKTIGKVALAKQSDTIRLVPASDAQWKDADAIRKLTEPLLHSGFQDAGTWTVEPLAGVGLKLVTDPIRSVYAIAYEHPRAGRWLEMVTLYADGTSITVSARPATGLDRRPGHPVMNLPGATPERLLDRILSARPEGTMLPVSAADAPRRFEQAWADGMAWRKNQGISRREVAKVSMRKVA
jgi:hypothetical protein